MVKMEEYLKGILMLSIIHSMPPFLRERMYHDVLRSLGYKLNNDELKQFHDFINPQMQWGYAPPTMVTVTNQDDILLASKINDETWRRKIIEFIKEQEEQDDGEI